MLHAATLKIFAAIVAKSRTQFYFVQRFMQLVSKKFRTLQSMLHGAMNRATCLAMALRDKLHEKLHRVTGPLKCEQTRNLHNERKVLAYFWGFALLLAKQKITVDLVILRETI